ncbi:MAG: alanine racemase [Myxococcota bacterium]
MTAPAESVSAWPRLASASGSLRPTRAEVDLGAVAHNLCTVRRAAGRSRVLAVVKADAYGHGMVPVAARLQREGVDGFGVALAEEGLELREAGISADILVLNGVYGGAHAAVLEAGLSPVVYDLSDVDAFRRVARGRPFGVHLKVDTGMSRLGVPLDRLEGFLDRLARMGPVRVEGVMTHLSSADADDEVTDLQLRRFGAALEQVAARGHRPRLVHAANSAATFRRPDARFEMVRPGIALFGHPPAPDVQADLKPAMRLRTEVIALRDLPPGAQIGYNGTFRVARPTRLATLPVGYGDGLFRGLSNRGAVLVRGRRCPIVGAVSMDLTTVDVTDAPGAAVGDEVVLLGAQGTQQITAGEIAGWAGTIPYEVLTNVSRRVPRFYRT